MRDDIDYVALVNEEGQHCLWPELKPAPAGWKVAGAIGTRAEVLEWIQAHWLDLRPVSLRELRAT